MASRENEIAKLKEQVNNLKDESDAGTAYECRNTLIRLRKI